MTLRHRLLACAGAALLLCTSTFAVAADTITVTVDVQPPTIRGTFTALFHGARFDEIEFDPLASQYSYGYVSMYVEDKRGTDAPWEVQFTVGDFHGANTGGVIPASGMTNQSVSIYDAHGSFASPDYYDPALQIFHPVSGLWSATGNQTGRYGAQWLGHLLVPAGTEVDSYTSTLTLDVTSAP